MRWVQRSGDPSARHRPFISRVGAGVVVLALFSMLAGRLAAEEPEILFLDVDGTLLDDQQPEYGLQSKGQKKALNWLIALGEQRPVCVVTGRVAVVNGNGPPSPLERILKATRLHQACKNGWVIAGGGAQILRPDFTLDPRLTEWQRQEIKQGCNYDVSRVWKVLTRAAGLSGVSLQGNSSQLGLTKKLYFDPRNLARRRHGWSVEDFVARELRPRLQDAGITQAHITVCHDPKQHVFNIDVSPQKMGKIFSARLACRALRIPMNRAMGAGNDKNDLQLAAGVSGPDGRLIVRGLGYFGSPSDGRRTGLHTLMQQLGRDRPGRGGRLYASDRPLIRGVRDAYDTFSRVPSRQRKSRLTRAD